MRTKHNAKLIFPRALLPSEDPKAAVDPPHENLSMFYATYDDVNNLALRAEREGLGGGWRLVQGLWDWHLERQHGKEFTLRLFIGRYPPRYWTIDGVLYRNRTDGPDYVHAYGYVTDKERSQNLGRESYQLYTADFRAMANILLSME